MARPTNKAALLEAAQTSFDKLWQTIDGMEPQVLSTPFDFSDQPNKKEAHWQRDRNLRDVLTHLYEWHQLLINWIERNQAGESAPFLPPPYNWKTYGEMNLVLWQQHQATSLDAAIELVTVSHAKALAHIETFSDQALFTKQYFDWTGSTTLGSYCVSALSSHYEWAIKKLRAHNKACAKRLSTC